MTTCVSEKIKRGFPAGTKITVKKTKTEIYTGVVNGKFVVRAYKARAGKSFAYYSFSSIEKMREYVNSLVDLEHKRGIAKEKDAQAKRAPHTLQVGDILYTSWGYDQTNVNFYQVTALKGKSTVEVRELAQSRIATSSMSSDALPIPNEFISEPTEHRANSYNSIKVSNQRAYLLQYTVNPDTGEREYEKRYVSFYH